MDKDKLIKALIVSDGIVIEAEQALGVSHATIYKYIKEYDLMPLIEELRNNMVDNALSTVKANMDNPDVALKYLNYHTRRVGTGFKLNVDKDSGVTITVNSKEDADDLNEFLK